MSAERNTLWATSGEVHRRHRTGRVDSPVGGGDGYAPAELCPAATPTHPRHDTQSLYAPHRQPGAFFCPWQPFTTTPLDVLRWKLGGRGPYDRKTPPRIPVVANDGAYLKDGSQPASITWVGHSTFAVQDGGEVFLTDPHWGPRALVPPPAAPPGIPLAAVPGDAFVVLSHNHYDHLDAWTVSGCLPDLPWFVPLGLGRLAPPPRPAAGRRARLVAERRHGRWTLTCLPAQHWSNRLDMGRNATLWGSWLLDSGSRRYYFAGDSGYFHGFAEIGRRFGPSTSPSCRSAPTSRAGSCATSTWIPREALQAFRDLGARRMAGMHWGTFDLTDEPVDLAPRVLEEVLEEEGADRERVRTLAVGERWIIAP